MAMVRYGGAIIEKEGKQGGWSYWHDWCMNHVTSYRYHRLNPTKKQRLQRRYFTTCKNAWMSHAWTRAEIDGWWRWCYARPKKNKKGETFYLHPYLAFMSVNMKRLADGLPIIYTAP